MTSLFLAVFPPVGRSSSSFFKFSCRLASSRNSVSELCACLPFHSLKPCMHVRFSGCVVILIVLPYYSNYLYSTLNLPYMIGLIKYSCRHFTANENEKARCNLWLSRTKGSSLPSLFNLITLIPYLFSLLPFACLACLCAGLCSHTLGLTPYPTWCVGLSTRLYLYAIIC
jgi:hypothetical protein